MASSPPDLFSPCREAETLPPGPGEPRLWSREMSAEDAQLIKAMREYGRWLQEEWQQ